MKLVGIKYPFDTHVILLYYPVIEKKKKMVLYNKHDLSNSLQ